MLSVKTYAKINFGLSILGKREDGYHNIESVFQKIDLYDEMYIERTKSGITLNTDTPPYGESNICYRVIERFFTLSGIEDGVKVCLQKKIWPGSGLGGASSNAATLLLGLNQVFGYPLSKETLFEIAISLGSDIPFFLNGNTAIVSGRGEVISPLHIHLPIYLVLVYPGFSIKTEWAYEAIDKKKIRAKMRRKKSVDLIVKSMREKDIVGFAFALFNDFEEVVFKQHPILAGIKNRLLRYGCIGTSLSGSGSVVYGILRERRDESGWKRCMGSEDVQVVKCL